MQVIGIDTLSSCKGVFLFLFCARVAASYAARGADPSKQFDLFREHVARIREVCPGACGCVRFCCGSLSD
jgi:hypothetical protein